MFEFIFLAASLTALPNTFEDASALAKSDEARLTVQERAAIDQRISHMLEAAVGQCP